MLCEDMERKKGDTDVSLSLSIVVTLNNVVERGCDFLLSSSTHPSIQPKIFSIW